MIHIIFWLYILSLVVMSISIFLSTVLAKRIGEVWYRFFIYAMSFYTLYLLCYTIFYFAYRYGNGINELLEFTMFSSEWLIYFICTLVLFRLTEGVLEKRYKRGARLFLLSLQLLSLVFFVMVIFTEYDLHFIISVLFLIVYVFTLFIDIVRNWKIIMAKREKRIILYMVALSLITFPLEVIEYYIFKAFIPADTYIPIGIVATSIFCLLMGFFNIMHSIRFFYSILHPEEDDEEVIDYEDVPDTFIEAFAITGRESEIVEYIVKGYNHQDIAGYLNISKRTVEKHSYNVYKKCEINNRVELMNLIRDYQ